MKSLFLQMKAILVGAYEKKDGDNKTLVLTTLGQQVNEKTGGKLVEQLNVYVYMKLIYSHLFFELTELIVHSFHTPVELVHWNAVKQDSSIIYTKIIRSLPLLV